MNETPTDVGADTMTRTQGGKHRTSPSATASIVLVIGAAALGGACGTSDETARCEGGYQAVSGEVEFTYRAQSSIEVLVPGDVEPTGTTSPSANWIEIRDAGPTFVVLSSMAATVGDGAWVSPEFTEFCAESAPVFVNELSSDDDAALEVFSAGGTTHAVTLRPPAQLVRGQTSSMQFPDFDSE